VNSLKRKKSKCLSLYSDVSDAKYDALVRGAYAILVPIMSDSKHPIASLYFKSRCTSSIPLAVSYGIPFVADIAFSGPYHLFYHDEFFFSSPSMLLGRIDSLLRKSFYQYARLVGDILRMQGISRFGAVSAFASLLPSSCSHN
jgi:hypothetical protein